MNFSKTLATRTPLFSSSSTSMELLSPIRTRHLTISPLQAPPQTLPPLIRKFPAIQSLRSIASTAIETPSACSEYDLANDTVEELLSPKGRGSSRGGGGATIGTKLERKNVGDGTLNSSGRWFPYLDRFRGEDVCLSSEEVLEALRSYLLDSRKERMRRVVESRSYSVCLVVEGLSDYGNVSAAFRSADALGVQSVHVVACDSSKRYKENRLVSMGAEKWLDIELWDSAPECFVHLRSRGYRIAATRMGSDAVSICDVNWSYPTAIVVGNEGSGISKEALGLSDLHCSIPMTGMVDSFNVSVAAGILMHHAVWDRTLRLGSHGDLTQEQRQILLAEFCLRHSKAASSIAVEYAKRKRTNACFE